MVSRTTQRGRVSSQRRARVAIAAMIAGLLAQGAASAAEPLDLAQAIARASQHSGKLGGAQAAIEQAQAQVEAAQGLGGPVLALSALGYSFDRTQSVSLQPFAGQINGLINGLPIPPGLLPIPIDIPSIPDSVNLRLRKTGAAGFVNGLLPLYTGGRIEGVRHVAVGRAAEAVANGQQEGDEVLATLLQRYFGVQAAARLAAVREAALAGVASHLETAKRLEAAGLIARVERLQADVAFANAGRDVAKARHDLALAQRALASMLDLTVSASAPDLPLATPLFVDSQPLPPLDGYIARSLDAHPGLAVVRAKRAQASALGEIEHGVHKPSVFAFGVVEPHKLRPDWMLGVAFNWVLVDGIDRDALQRSTLASERRVDASERQARADIALLVERNYRNVDQARVRFLSLRADDELAREMLRLRQKGLNAGTSTSLDLIDAQLNLAKVQAEQAGAAFDYSQALAALLGATGDLGQFAQRAASADIQLR
jgi:outer membrane protein TolC